MQDTTPYKTQQKKQYKTSQKNQYNFDLTNKTPKLYLENYNIKQLTPNVLENVDLYYKFTKKAVQMLSPLGIFSIQGNNIIQKTPKDESTQAINYENLKFMLDRSYFEEEEIYSQMPVEHYVQDTTTFYYCQGEISKLYLVIEGYYTKTQGQTQQQQTFNQIKYGRQKYVNFVPTNFYFLLNEDFDNYFVKKELNVFLSLLI